MNEKRRKSDNGARKYFKPSWVALILILAGGVITFVSKVRTIPKLTEDVRNNTYKITKIETNIEWIKDGIKTLLKEK